MKEIPMSWLKRIIRSPLFMQVVIAVLQLATQIVRQERRKKKGEK